jgi:ABC-type Fe3+/spermidine/putrescine transport system ATPase subunit
MHKGKVEQIGTPKEVYNRPASLFVAQFIGKANFLQGTVQQIEKERAIVEVNNQQIKAVLSTNGIAHQKIQPNQTVTLMIRPERIRINRHTPADNQVNGSIESVTYIGQSLQLQVKTNLGMLMMTELYDGGDRSDRNLTLFWSAEDCVVIEANEEVV